MPTASELPIDTSATAMDMANAMFGNGITIQTASYTGADTASGIYTNGDSVAPGVTPSDTGVILSTGKAADITNSSGDVNTSAGTSTDQGTAGDSDLTAISGQQTYDAAVFEADFVPDGSTLTMQITFSSEEYLEYVNSGFNDAVGVWVNGEQAVLTVGTGNITIDNINDQSNQNLYVDNSATADNYNTEMDGFTVTLTLKAPVNPGQINTIKIGVADAGDSVYDSNLLIAGNSVQTALIAEDDAISVEGTNAQEFDLLANDSSSSGGSLTITAINGQPVVAGDTITLPTGEMITLTADGIVVVESDGEEGSNSFTYTVKDSEGNTDIAFVNLTTTAPCFTAGTLIDTPDGAVAIEQLNPGDLVQTLDHGPQPVRWVGTSRRLATGADAPIAFTKGALGDHDALELSPNHRVLVASPLAELMFESWEVLVLAKTLVNGTSITRRSDGQMVTYVHLLFDQHQIIIGNGLPSESYHPGCETLTSFDNETREEILRLFPALETPGPGGYGPTARMALKPYEARALLAG